MKLFFQLPLTNKMSAIFSKQTSSKKHKFEVIKMLLHFRCSLNEDNFITELKALF